MPTIIMFIYGLLSYYNTHVPYMNGKIKIFALHMGIQLQQLYHHDYNPVETCVCVRVWL